MCGKKKGKDKCKKTKKKKIIIIIINKRKCRKVEENNKVENAESNTQRRKKRSDTKIAHRNSREKQRMHSDGKIIIVCQALAEDK